MQSESTLATISNGQVPSTRMADAESTQAFAQRLRQNDEKRAKKRALVNGLVDGNPPYKAAKLRDAGMANACNVNWGTARSYMESGAGAFYDLASEAPGFIGVTVNYGTPEEREIWGRVLSKEADRILARDTSWDWSIQHSQNEMTLHGCGPLVFESEFQVLPTATRCGELRVPERTKANTDHWEAATVDSEYYPPELYEFIQNEKAAAAVGWNVAYVKKVIEAALRTNEGNGTNYDWEYYQQQLKNNSFDYFDDTRVCKLVHCFWREFDGRITHGIVERDNTVGNTRLQRPTEQPESVKYLYLKVGRYESWAQCIHPMYFDRGNGGFHHSVTGLGVKMYGSMEYENRLLCNGMDKAFRPSLLFRPTSAETAQRFQLTRHADYGVVPPGYETQQMPTGSFIEDVLVMYRASSDLMRSNLSSYRQQAPTRKEGNPVTAFEKQMEASQMSALSKTTFNRYYKQLDALYAEIVRRLCLPATTEASAKEFQKRCKEQGVPAQAFSKIDQVQAIRVIGQGSAFMRKVSVDSLMPVVGSLPEEGRNNWLKDKIAAEAGQSAVTRYFPERDQKLASDQQSEAAQWVGTMKTGVPHIITSSQSAPVYAATFISAGVQALQSLQQGADPMEVLAFLDVIGPAAMAHLQRFSQDQLRAELYAKLLEQWQSMSAVTDDLRQQVQQMQQQRQAQAQATQQAMTQEQIAMAKFQGDEARRNAKAQQALQQKAESHMQKLALSDASTASNIDIAQRRSAAELALMDSKTEASQE
jgi:hypothetical protein